MSRAADVRTVAARGQLAFDGPPAELPCLKLLDDLGNDMHAAVLTCTNGKSKHVCERG